MLRQHLILCMKNILHHLRVRDVSERHIQDLVKTPSYIFHQVLAPFVQKNK